MSKSEEPGKTSPGLPPPEVAPVLRAVSFFCFGAMLEGW
jgi:hypothetical protein